MYFHFIYLFGCARSYLQHMQPFLVAECGILVPCPRTEPGVPKLGGWILSHWTTREVPGIYIFKIKECREMKRKKDKKNKLKYKRQNDRQAVQCSPSS